MKAKTLIMILATTLAASAQGELKWEKKEIELHPSITDETAVANFKYQNTGDKLIRITGVQSSCGCTAATAGKNDVGPGESGEIKATFKMGNRVGLQKKTVTVTTDDPANASTVLTLTAMVPQLLEINPTFVFWKGGEPTNPKIITVKVGGEFPVTDLKVTPSSPDFTVKVERGAAKEFRVVVQPTQTDRNSTVTLTIQPDFPKDPPKVYFASARIMPAEGTAGAAAKPVPVSSAAPSAPPPHGN